MSRRSNESCVHLKCLYKWQGPVRRPTFSFWSPPPCSSGSWSHIPTLRKSGAGPSLVVDVIFLYFSTDQQDLSLINKSFGFIILLLLSLLFSVLQFLLFCLMLCILCLLYVIPFSPAFSITDIFCKPSFQF